MTLQNESAVNVDDLLCDFQGTLRNCILSAAQRLLNLPDMKDLDPPELDYHVYAAWMTFILVAGPACKINLKIHFDTNSARNIAAHRFGMKESETPEHLGIDFMREMANMCGGAVKALFINAGVEVGLGLPVLTRGYDELHFSHDKALLQDHWVASNPFGRLQFSTSVLLQDWNILNKVLQAPAAVEPEDTMEFL